KLAGAGGGRDVHGPMTGAADIASAAGFERLIGADLVADVMAAARSRIHGLAELVVEAFGGEIAFLLGDPFVQPEMRRDDEFRHRAPPLSRFCSGGCFTHSGKNRIDNW